MELLYTFMLCFVVPNVAASKKHAGKYQFYGLAIGFVIVAGGYGAGHISGVYIDLVRFGFRHRIEGGIGELRQEEDLRASDGNNIITVGSERFRRPEMRFQPGLVDKEASGLHDATFRSIMDSATACRTVST